MDGLKAAVEEEIERNIRMLSDEESARFLAVYNNMIENKELIWQQ